MPEDPFSKLLKNEDTRAKLFLISLIVHYVALAALCIGFLIFILKALNII